MSLEKLLAEDKPNKVIQFIDNRKKFVLELCFWLGIVLIVGFVRVNFFNGSVSASMPEYRTYSVLGSLTEREPDYKAYVDNNTGAKKGRKGEE